MLVALLHVLRGNLVNLLSLSHYISVGFEFHVDFTYVCHIEPLAKLFVNVADTWKVFEIHSKPASNDLSLIPFVLPMLLFQGSKLITITHQFLLDVF